MAIVNGTTKRLVNDAAEGPHAANVRPDGDGA